VDTNNNRIEQWTVATPSSDEHTAYYTAATNNGHPACGGHPEWANMPCQTAPVAQPGTVGLPTLPVTTVAYNMYGQPTSATSTVNECVKVSPGAGKYTNSTCTTTGSGEYETKTNTRTTTIGYDTIGRPEMSETTATTGTALPKVTDKYSATTGMPIEQATSTESIKSAYNALGQLTSYTDASGKTTTSEYEGEGKYAGEKELDGRPRAVNDGQGTETYTYNETTGTLSKLAISGAGAFTASYDIEGNMLGVHYPDGMSATYTYNATGKPTNLVYDKETHCTEGCEWFKDSVVPSIHGQWATQRSSLGTDTYTYDATGRLIEATQTPTGKGCATRRYTYDEDTNRTSLTAYSPNSKNECSTTSGSSEEKHSYDEADRLTDAGVAYEPFGETTKLPATDAGGSELVSTFYADGQLREQKQGEGAQAQAIGYTLDPADRTGEVVSTGKVVATETLHYNGPASTPSWTSEPSGKTTRMMSAMSGLVAIQHGSETPTLQLANLHGDIVGTAEDSETANKLASTILEPTEYGVPATEAPPKYSWLGAHELPTELPSGVIAMGVRSYVPKLGRFLQTDPVAGGSANAYAYVFGDPVNETDLTGADGMPAWLIEANNHEALELTEAATARRIEAEERKAAEEAAARAAAQAAAEAAARAAATAAITAESPYGESYEEEWGEEEWGEEEGEEEWEYVSDHHNADSGYKEAHIEPGLLVQRLTTNSTVPLCNASSEGPCVRTVSGHKKRRHKGHHCDLQFQACVKCPPGYEEIPIGGEKCFPSAPPDSGSSNSKKEWWEGGIMVSGYRRR
jgi:RHS repeat-associated protein